MLALALKLTLAPGLVAGATLVSRSMGERFGGLVAGLPVVAGPIALIYAVEHGRVFGQAASAAALLGILSLIAFCLVYALTARRFGLLIALAASWLAFGLSTFALVWVAPPLLVSVAIVLLAVTAASALIPREAVVDEPVARRSDLLIIRLVLTALLVLGVTAVAGSLSAHVAGLLVPFPIITAVLAGFTHARVGAGAAVEFLAGLVRSLLGFVVFFAVLGELLAVISTAAAFAVATVAGVASWGALLVHDAVGRARAASPALRSVA